MTFVFTLGMLLLAVLGHGYLWTDTVNVLHAWHGPRKLIDALTMFCLAAFLALPLVVLVSWSQLGSVRGSFVYPADFWTKGYYLLCVAFALFKLLINVVYRAGTDRRRTLVRWDQEPLHIGEQAEGVELTGKVARFCAKIPANQVLQLVVDRKQLAIPRLPVAHEGLTIAHISDLHMTGRIGRSWYELIAEQVNRLEPDVIAITGDIVENEACWPWLANSLGRLRAKYGVYFILGNHDYYIDTNQTIKLLEDQGLISLSGRKLETVWGEAQVQLAGNELPWNQTVASLPVASLPNASASDVESRSLRLGLLHTPDQFSWACEQQLDLALAGHTHGGQLRFPLLGPIACPSLHSTRYACGVFQRGETVLHVSRGISGKTPLRWNCPPEIALLELVRPGAGAGNNQT